MNFAITVTGAIVGGVFPALVWLWFWLKEDKRKPEPAQRIMATFLGGTIAVFVAMLAEYYLSRLVSPYAAGGTSLYIWLVVILAPVIEEVVKYGATYITAFRHKICDEPVDVPIYMITTALGFAAIENVFFLLEHFQDNIIAGIISGNFRFMGATLLHLLASAAVGVCIALVYYRSRSIRIAATVVGLCIAIALHGAFNYLIMNSIQSQLFATFIFVWIATVVLLILFEKIKRKGRLHRQKYGTSS